MALIDRASFLSIAIRIRALQKPLRFVCPQFKTERLSCWMIIFPIKEVRPRALLEHLQSLLSRDSFRYAKFSLMEWVVQST